jgi:Flp pilus assembly protein TadB
MKWDMVLKSSEREKMKNNKIIILFIASGVFFLILAGLYSLIKEWANFAICLTIANILLVCGLQESNYRRFVRKIDELKQFISESK